MRTLEGIVTVVQEGRFQLETDGGDSHVFILAHDAAAETDQLPRLQHEQARVRVAYEDGPGVIAYVAHEISVIPGRAGQSARP